MPFINAKVSVAMTDIQKETVKVKLGEAITLIPGKSENWLMVGFEDQYDLYFQGNQSGATAFIEVKVFGTLTDEASAEMTERVCNIFQSELNIPKDRIYIKYEEVQKWGWNGQNF